jgi:hypothetical protein
MMTRSQTIAATAAVAAVANATATATATSNVISSDDDTTKVVYPSMFSRWAEPL